MLRLDINTVIPVHFWHFYNAGTQCCYSKNSVVITAMIFSVGFEACKQNSFCDSEAGRFSVQRLGNQTTVSTE